MELYECTYTAYTFPVGEGGDVWIFDQRSQMLVAVQVFRKVLFTCPVHETVHKT